MARRFWAAALAGATGLSVLLAGAPALADPVPQLLVSQVRSSTGKLDFMLSGPGLPDLATVNQGTVTVSVEGQPLVVQVKDTKSMTRNELPIRGLVLVVETTNTMTGATLQTVQTALGEYLAAVPEEVAVGVVGFAGSVTVGIPLSNDRTAIKSALSRLGQTGATSPEPSPTTPPSPSGAASSAKPSGGTSKSSGPAVPQSPAPNQTSNSALYDAVTQGADLFDTTYQERRLLVVTDGPDRGSKTSASDAAKALTEGQIGLDLVGFGATAATAIAEPVASLVGNTGGQATTAANADALKPILAGWKSRLPQAIAVSATVPASFQGRSTAMTVRVVAGGKDLSTTVPVSFDTTGATTNELKTVQLRVLPVAILLIALVLFALALLIIGFVAVNLILGRSAARERTRQLERITGKVTKSTIDIDGDKRGSALLQIAMSLSDRIVQRQDRGAVEVALDRAGIALRPEEWTLVRAGVAALGALLLSTTIPILAGIPLGAGIGWYLTGWYCKHRAVKRATKFSDLLPDALQLVVGALRSGFSLMQSLDAVVREGPEPVASEFGRAMAEIRIGGELEAALERTAERNGSKDLAWLVMAIRIQREVGGNLSEVMETAVETMRERGRLVRHVRALSAEGRLSAYVLVGMPICITAWMAVFRGEYLRPLYSQPLGLVVIAAGVFLVALGAFWISRLIKVEV